MVRKPRYMKKPDKLSGGGARVLHSIATAVLRCHGCVKNNGAFVLNILMRHEREWLAVCTELQTAPPGCSTLHFTKNENGH